MEKRGRRAGIARLHPHQIRHTFASQWLAQGGNEGDLMQLAGWCSRAMLNRYGASAAGQRAGGPPSAITRGSPVSLIYDQAVVVSSLLGLAALVAAFHFFMGTEEVERWSRPTQIGLGLPSVVFLVSVGIGTDGIREIKGRKGMHRYRQGSFWDVRDCFLSGSRPSASL